MAEVKVMAVTGILGCIFPEESLKEALKRKPDILGVDAGSMDGGAYPLGEGTCGISLEAIYRDLSIVLPAAIENNIPLVIGSAGLAGGEPHIKLLMDMVYKVQKEKGLRKFSVAVIHAEIDRDYIKTKIKQGRITPMPGNIPDLTEEIVDGCSRIVGQMGVTPYIEAFKKKTDVIIAGRSCDTAIFASYPIMKGCGYGPTIHGSKIMECGAYAAEPARPSEGIFATFRDDEFELDTLNPEIRCTPMSVAAHTLYENDHPTSFTEPDGTVDCSESTFEQITPTAVRVRNTKYTHVEPGKGTIKLEGAYKVGYRSIVVAGVHDPEFIKQYEFVEAEAREKIEKVFGPSDGKNYSVFFRAYGKDGVMQDLETHERAKHELGIVIDAVAETQEMATSVVGIARHAMMHSHYPGRKTVGGNIAIAFSPVDIPVGAVYEFAAYHIMEVDDLNELFPIEIVEVG
jgi:hypothetical protein